MPRQPNGRPGINLNADGRYHTWVTVGVKPDGSEDRPHISRRTATEVANAVDALKKRHDRGAGGKTETVAEWLTYYLEEIVRPNRAYKTYEAYRPIVHMHVIPNIGGYRLDGMKHVLRVEHVERMYNILGRTLAPSYVLQVHRVLRKALEIAYRRGKSERNVCDLLDAPGGASAEIASLSLTDAQAVIRAAVEDPMAPRWLIAILLGLRQGETLGLRWHRIDLEEGIAWVPKQIQRHAWQHGCDDPHACGSKSAKGGKPAHRFKPCKATCWRHTGKRGCPPPCTPDCAGHARLCPQKHGGGMVEVDTKSKTGAKEGIPLGAVLVEHLRGWRERQIQELDEVGKPFDPEGLVFTGPDGAPVDSRRDHERWEALLVAAGVKDARLHAARHTAGSLMVASGTDISVVQEILRHVDIRTTRRYVDVANDLKREAVDRIASSLFDGSLMDLLKPSTAPNAHRSILNSKGPS